MRQVQVGELPTLISRIPHWRLWLAAIPSIAMALPASAQNDEEQLEEIVVTGSQIRGASTTAALPVSVVNREDIATAGVGSADELFRYLPGVGAVGFGGNNQRSTSFGINGSRGDVASINLRSLGEGNTLVLMNGRRLVDHPSTQTDEQTAPAVAVNMNAIPVLGLERVEVLRDGASALYGTDAVAGVVNTILRKDYDGIEVTARYGSADALDETTIGIIGGLNFNNGQTNITGSFTYHDRSELGAIDRDWARVRDARPLIDHPDFTNDSAFRNSSDITPWGTFQVPAGTGQIMQDQGAGPVPITDSAGRFTLLPDSIGGCTTNLPSSPSDVCAAALARVPDSLRHNRNAGATLMPGVERTNFFGTATHTFDNDFEIYTELGLYRAKSFYNRNDGGGGPLSTQPIHMAAEGYYNPFGPLLLPDGSPNPNRLSGLDLGQVPAEGLPLCWRCDAIDGTRARFRVLERPGPFVNVTDESYRVVQGLRGNFGDWDFDTGLVFSRAETLDRTDNRLDLNAFMRQLSLPTPDAYNPFTGAGTYVNNANDSTLNPASSSDPFYITVERLGVTRMQVADFKLSNNALWEMSTLR